MKITVCIPLYNGADSVRDALQSLVDQTRRADEVIVVDDCSRDNFQEIIDEFSRILPIKSFRNEKNLGMICNWNVCLQKATGEMIAFLHQDDGYFPNFLAVAEDEFKKEPKIGFWACMGQDKVSSTGAKPPVSKYEGLMEPAIFGELVYLWEHIPPPTVVVFRRTPLDRVGHYNNQYRYVAEPDLYFRLAVAGYYFRQTAKVLVWRTTPQNRATATYHLSALYFEEWFKFLDSWTGHPLLRFPLESGAEALRNVAVEGGGRIAMCLIEGKFKTALEIIGVIRMRGFAMSEKVNASKITLIVMLIYFVARNFYSMVRNMSRSLLGKVYRWVKSTGKKYARKQEYQKAGSKFKEQLPVALRKAAKGDYAAIRQLFRESSLFDFWSYYLCGPHYEIPWSGKQMTKLPMDYWIYRDLIESSRPKIILEIGTQRGTSALMLAEIGRKVNAHVVTVDIVSPPAHVLEEFNKEGVIFVLGNAIDKAVTEDILSIVRGKPCLVLDDGSHLKDEVIKVFGAFSKLVPAGGYYIVAGAFSNWLIEQKSNDALGGVDEILKRSGGFKRYDHYDKFVFFSAFRGILKREEMQ